MQRSCTHRLWCHTLIFVLLFLAGCMSMSVAEAQPYDIWRPLLHVEALLDTLPITPLHFSSWARNGGNNDLGNYLQTLPDNWKLLADVQGAGVLTGIWFTRRTFDGSIRLRIFADDTVTARIDTPLVQLFGLIPPFTAPLADSSNCAYFSYVPIPFQSRLRVMCQVGSIYYHADVSQYPPGTTVTSFTWPPSADYLTHVDSLRNRFLAPSRPAWAERPFTSITGSATLAAHAKQDLVNYAGARGCRRLLLRLDNHTAAALDNLWLRIYTDDRILPDIEGAVSAIFGAMQGWRSYQSVITGVCGDSLYLNLPARFDRRLRIEAENYGSSGVTCTAIVELVDLASEVTGSLRLRSEYHDQNPTVPGQRYTIAKMRGQGQFAGLTLDIHTHDNHVLEGDEEMYADGNAEPFWRGTGTEDYVKGGYYWCGGTRVLALPSHGCTVFHSLSGMAMYRAHVIDPVPFHSGYRMTMEVGPYDELTAHYRSAAFFYLLPERWQVKDQDGDGGSGPGEVLQIAGYGLTPGTMLNEIRLGTMMLSPNPEHPTADSTGRMEFTAVTPTGGNDGFQAIEAELSGGTEIVDSAWEYHSTPLLNFYALRADVDSFAFALDTLSITVRGLATGATATVFAGEHELPWTTFMPTADSAGVLQAMARIPEGILPGDYSVHATSPGGMDASCTQRIRLREFYRLELESLPTAVGPGMTYSKRFAPDYAAVGHSDPWGFNRVQLAWATAAGSGHYLQSTFMLPVSGRYRLEYFFGRYAGGATVRTVLDGDTDLTAYDSYSNAAGSWRWLRSDTVQGQSWQLAAGLHTLRFEIAGHNPAATDSQMVLDQIVLVPVPAPTPSVPIRVKELIITPDSGSSYLRWRPVRTDTAGQPLENVSYVVFRAIGSTEPEIRGIVVDPDTQFVDDTADIPVGKAVSYFVLSRTADPAQTSGTGADPPCP
jgi:hypothetical protein